MRTPTIGQVKCDLAYLKHSTKFGSPNKLPELPDDVIRKIIKQSIKSDRTECLSHFRIIWNYFKSGSNYIANEYLQFKTVFLPIHGWGNDNRKEILLNAINAILNDKECLRFMKTFPNFKIAYDNNANDIPEKLLWEIYQIYRRKPTPGDELDF